MRSRPSGAAARVREVARPRALALRAAPAREQLPPASAEPDLDRLRSLPVPRLHLGRSRRSQDLRPLPPVRLRSPLRPEPLPQSRWSLVLLASPPLVLVRPI